MKYLCDACERLVEPRGTSTSGPLGLICSRCGAPTPIGAPAEAAAPPLRAMPSPVERSEPPASNPGDAGASTRDATPALSPEERCPKCTWSRSTNAAACPKCGLVFSLYKPTVEASEVIVASQLLRLLENPLPEAEKKLGVMGPEQLMALARQCRLRLAEYPGDAAAQALLDAISKRSLAQVVALSAVSRGASSPQGSRARVVAYVAVGVALLTALTSVAYAMARFLT